MYPDFTPRFPWQGGDLQTLRYYFFPASEDLSAWPSERLSFPLPNTGGDALLAVLHRPNHGHGPPAGDPRARAHQMRGELLHVRDHALLSHPRISGHAPQPPGRGAVAGHLPQKLLRGLGRQRRSGAVGPRNRGGPPRSRAAGVFPWRDRGYCTVWRDAPAGSRPSARQRCRRRSTWQP